jgi:hypothetical protein
MRITSTVIGQEQVRTRFHSSNKPLKDGCLIKAEPTLSTFHTGFTSHNGESVLHQNTPNRDWDR